MFGSIRRVLVLLLAGSVMWSCSGERVTTPQVTDADLSVGGPLSKPAVSRDLTKAVVVARVHQDQVPVSGATVEFSRSVSGRAADYAWSGTTDENGEARVEIEGDNVSGYYQARAMQDGSMLGSWSSIPINGGYELMVDLPVGGKARVTGSSILVLESIVGSWGYVGTDIGQTVSKKLENALVDLLDIFSSLLGLDLDPAAVAMIVQEFTSEMETSISDTLSSIRRFNADGSFEDDDGNTGAWFVSGNLLTMVDADGFTIEGTYFVDGDNLTLSFTRDQYFQIIGQEVEDVDEEAQVKAFLDAIIEEGDTIRFFFGAG
jgi:hypothetical protein